MDIKNCPFCGGEAIYKIDTEPDGYCHYTVGFIKCDKCGCQTPHLIIDGYYGATTKEEDVYKIWNKRV